MELLAAGNKQQSTIWQVKQNRISDQGLLAAFTTIRNNGQNGCTSKMMQTFIIPTINQNTGSGQRKIPKRKRMTVTTNKNKKNIKTGKIPIVTMNHQQQMPHQQQQQQLHSQQQNLIHQQQQQYNHHIQQHQYHHQYQSQQNNMMVGMPAPQQQQQYQQYPVQNIPQSQQHHQIYPHQPQQPPQQRYYQQQYTPHSNTHSPQHQQQQQHLQHQSLATQASNRSIHPIIESVVVLPNSLLPPQTSTSVALAPTVSQIQHPPSQQVNVSSPTHQTHRYQSHEQLLLQQPPPQQQQPPSPQPQQQQMCQQQQLQCQQPQQQQSMQPSQQQIQPPPPQQHQQQASLQSQQLLHSEDKLGALLEFSGIKNQILNDIDDHCDSDTNSIGAIDSDEWNWVCANFETDTPNNNNNNNNNDNNNVADDAVTAIITNPDSITKPVESVNIAMVVESTTLTAVTEIANTATITTITATSTPTTNNTIDEHQNDCSRFYYTDEINNKQQYNKIKENQMIKPESTNIVTVDSTTIGTTTVVSSSDVQFDLLKSANITQQHQQLQVEQEILSPQTRTSVPISIEDIPTTTSTTTSPKRNKKPSTINEVQIIKNDENLLYDKNIYKYNNQYDSASEDNSEDADSDFEQPRLPSPDLNADFSDKNNNCDGVVYKYNPRLRLPSTQHPTSTTATPLVEQVVNNCGLSIEDNLTANKNNNNNNKNNNNNGVHSIIPKKRKITISPQSMSPIVSPKRTLKRAISSQLSVIQDSGSIVTSQRQPPSPLTVVTTNTDKVSTTTTPPQPLPPMSSITPNMETPIIIQPKENEIRYINTCYMRKNSGILQNDSRKIPINTFGFGRRNFCTPSKNFRHESLLNNDNNNNATKITNSKKIKKSTKKQRLNDSIENEAPKTVKKAKQLAVKVAKLKHQQQPSPIVADDETSFLPPTPRPMSDVDDDDDNDEGCNQTSDHDTNVDEVSTKIIETEVEESRNLAAAIASIMDKNETPQPPINVKISKRRRQSNQNRVHSPVIIKSIPVVSIAGQGQQQQQQEESTVAIVSISPTILNANISNAIGDGDVTNNKDDGDDNDVDDEDDDDDPDYKIEQSKTTDNLNGGKNKKDDDNENENSSSDDYSEESSSDEDSSDDDVDCNTDNVKASKSTNCDTKIDNNNGDDDDVNSERGDDDDDDGENKPKERQKRLLVVDDFNTIEPTTIVRRPISSNNELANENVVSKVLYRKTMPTGDHYQRPRNIDIGRLAKIKQYKPVLYRYDNLKLNLNEATESELRKYKKMPKPQEFCRIRYGNEIPATDCEMVYPDKSLKSLAKIAKSIMSESYKKLDVTKKIGKTAISPTMTPLDLRVIKSKIGDALRDLSISNYEGMKHFRRLINNSSVYESRYTLVYGAVPNHMCEFIQYVIKTNYNSSAPNMYMYDGDLEIQAFCYWQLVSQDLIEWKDDLSRGPLKKILESACAMIHNAELRERISRFANFNDNHITAECLLQIKCNYVEIMESLSHMSSPEECGYFLDIWNTFMSKCGIHHYSCPHTMIQIATDSVLVKLKLETTFNEMQIQNNKYETGIKFTAMETEEMFQYVLKLFPTKLKLQQLQASTSHAFVHLCKIFAYHLIEMGIIVSNNTKITTQHVEGFRSRYKKLLSINTTGQHVPVFPNKFRNMRNVIQAQVSIYYQANNTGSTIPTIKVDKMASETLFDVINKIILKRTEIFCFFTKDDAFHQDDAAITQLLSREIDELFNEDVFTNINNVDAWIRTDDADLNEYNGTTGELEKSFYDKHVEEENKRRELLDSDYSCDEDDDAIDNSIDETAELHSELNIIKNVAPLELFTIYRREHGNSEDVTPSKAKRSRKNDESDGMTKTARNAKLKQEREQLRLAVETSKEYSNSGVLNSRVSCAMCFKRITNRCIDIGPKITVACCLQCHKSLVSDINRKEEDRLCDHAEICKRITYQYRRPVAFDNENKYIDNDNYKYVFATKYYNRNKLGKNFAKSIRKRKKTVLKSEQRSKEDERMRLADISDDDADTNNDSDREDDDDEDNNNNDDNNNNTSHHQNVEVDQQQSQPATKKRKRQLSNKNTTKEFKRSRKESS